MRERTEQMELSEKIQKLRKERGLTQEQFAEQLFVSRTAVSKWETGRGTPSMESLQMIAKFFDITLDELLRAEDIITIAENENKENISRFACYIDGIFNITAVVGLLLPLYKVEQNNLFYSVPLYQFKGWLAILYFSRDDVILRYYPNSNKQRRARNPKEEHKPYWFHFECVCNFCTYS